MPDPGSKAEILLWRENPSTGVAESSAKDVAFRWWVMDQIDSLRALHGRGPLDRTAVRLEIDRLTARIDSLADGT